MKLRDLAFKPDTPLVFGLARSPYLLAPDGRRARLHRRANGALTYSVCVDPRDERYHGEGAWHHVHDLTPLEVQALLAGHRLDPHQGETITPEVTR